MLFPDLNSKRFQVKFLSISQKMDILHLENCLIWKQGEVWHGRKQIENSSEYDYGLSFI